MPSIQLPVGKAALVTMTIANLDPNTAPQVTVGNAAKARATINPTNPRQLAVVGLEQTASSVNVRVTASNANGTTNADQLFDVIANAELAPVITLGEPTIVDPPTWA